LCPKSIYQTINSRKKNDGKINNGLVVSQMKFDNWREINDKNATNKIRKGCR